MSIKNVSKETQEILTEVAYEAENDLYPDWDIDDVTSPAPSAKPVKEAHISVRTSTDIKNKIKKYADKTHVSLSQAVNDLVLAGLNAKDDTASKKLKKLAQIINS
ncbi:MAG: hypothetical protein QM571_05445 [Micrococcaceae bacterium]